ncbi:hypothetical protein ACWCQK_42330 [Streptomyces sp. NPDC002306]
MVDFIIVDGTLIPTDRVQADQPYYRWFVNSGGGVGWRQVGLVVGRW